MTKQEIDTILNNLEQTNKRNIVIIDYANVDKWQESLRWKIGIRELGNLVNSKTRSRASFD